MAAVKVGVREFRERIASFLESDTPVAVTRRGETLGVYVPTRRRRRKAAEISELRAATDRLAEALSDVDDRVANTSFEEWFTPCQTMLVEGSENKLKLVPAVALSSVSEAELGEIFQGLALSNDVRVSPLE
jgi:hypothetical protein